MSRSSQTTFIAHLSDTHITGDDEDEESFVDANSRLGEAVTRIAVEVPSMHAILATGDLTNWGYRSQYRELLTLLAPLVAPVLAIPGNHDDRDNLREHFPLLPWADATHASWDVTINGHVRVIGLDSTIPGQSGASFDTERESWLCDVLSKATEPGVLTTILALHHPPFLSGIQWMDQSGFQHLNRLIGVLTNSGIDRIFCGHLHRPIQSVVAGIPAQVGLSTVQHVALNLDRDAGVALINDPAGYQIHRFQDRNSLSHTRYIATGEQTYRPNWADEFEAKQANEDANS